MRKVTKPCSDAPLFFFLYSIRGLENHKIQKYRVMRAQNCEHGQTCVPLVGAVAHRFIPCLLRLKQKLVFETGFVALWDDVRRWKARGVENAPP